MSRPLLFVFLFAFCLGIAAGEVWHTPTLLIVAAGSIAVALLSVRRGRWVSVALLGAMLGVWRMGGALTVAANDISRYVGQTMTAEGEVVLPSTIDGTAQRFELTDVTASGKPMVGKILVSVPAIPTIRAGTQVRVTCEITALTEISQRRRWSHGVHARCATLTVDVVRRHLVSWRATLGRWQERLLTYVRQQYNEPQASLLNGILVGNTDGMPDRLNTAFQATGTTHIVALSGFNVTIIMAMAVNWLVKLIGRRWAWIPALGLLIAFVVMSGASASVVRAAIMAVVVQVGLFIGRPINVGRLLAYTALLMAIVNPLIVWHDLGFQLSFLATVGLVALSKPMTAVLPWVSTKFGLRDNLATTLAAIVMTEPLLLWRFGRLSLVAPLVNTLVLPLIPLSMAVGAVSLLGLWIPWLAPVTVPVSDALLRLIVWLITTGASLPNALIYLAPAVTIFSGLVFVALAIKLITRDAQKTSST